MTNDPLLTIKALWERVLKIEDAPLDKSFVSLGGDSLKAMEIAFQIKRSLNVDVSPISILADMNLEMMCDVVATAQG